MHRKPARLNVTSLQAIPGHVTFGRRQRPNVTGAG
jgi:hypothetical protein